MLFRTNTVQALLLHSNNAFASSTAFNAECNLTVHSAQCPRASLNSSYCCSEARLQEGAGFSTCWIVIPGTKKVSRMKETKKPAMRLPPELSTNLEASDIFPRLPPYEW